MVSNTATSAINQGSPINPGSATNPVGVYFRSSAAGPLRRDMVARLEDYASEINEDPQANSVKRLAFDVSDALIRETLDLDSVEGLIRQIAEEGLVERADRLAMYHGSSAPGFLLGLLEDAARAGFQAFKTRIETLVSGLVFTAHPTFALPERIRDRLAAMAVSAPAAPEGIPHLPDPHLPDPHLDLLEEHRVMLGAIASAQGAIRALYGDILDLGRCYFPTQWRTLTPSIISVATWVGYDLDGRTDIHWTRSIAFKLDEKRQQLDHYAKALMDLGEGFEVLYEKMRAAEALTQQQVDAFLKDLDDRQNLTQAANLLTDEHAAKYTDLSFFISALDAVIPGLDDDRAKAAIILKSEMKVSGLGVARVHFRVNAAQIRGAIRADLNVEESVTDFGRVALTTAAKRVEETAALNINFASVFGEQMTARRQFMLCAQILKHIDQATPIRFLIAECERPATVMGALYLARLYGVSDKLDISPLFETPEALERGGRFMEQLLDEPVYVEYARTRGHLAIQIGYSDSGRFMGQIAAEMAAERLQVLLAKAIARRGLTGFGVLLFNTHGESMGRGAHPDHFTDRLDHLFTPWARDHYARASIPVLHETSFQGGDGVVHFGNETLAKSSVAHVLLHAMTPAEIAPDDAFYTESSFSWDIYRGLKDWQEKLFRDHDYRGILSQLAIQLMLKTGSRQTKRSAASDDDLSKVRAIPNNASLQQIGVPMNVVGGLGSVVRKEQERFLIMVARSDRARRLLRYVAKARELTSLPVLRAYAGLYDAGFWVARAARSSGKTRAAMIDVSAQLADQRHHVAFSRLANHLAADLIELDTLLAATDVGMPSIDRHKRRIPLHILHATRIALLKQAFVLIAQLPSFSRRHDVNRSDLIDMVIHLRLRDAIDFLNRVFPDHASGAAELLDLNEKADNDCFDHGYPRVQAEVVAPLKRLIGLLEEIAVAICHQYGAWG